MIKATEAYKGSSYHRNLQKNLIESMAIKSSGGNHEIQRV